MKYLITAIVAVVLVGCGKPEVDRALLDAASEGNIEAAKQAIADGADVNGKAGGELTPLHYAALDGYKEVAELLIDKGADVNMKNIVGYTPLDWAVGEDNTEIADLFRKHGGKTGEELKAEGK